MGVCSKLLEVWKLSLPKVHCAMEFQAPHLISLTVAEEVVVPVISNSVFQTDVEIAPLLGSSARFRVK